MNRRERITLKNKGQNSAALRSGERRAEERYGEEKESKQDELSSECRGNASVGHLPMELLKE